MTTTMAAGATGPAWSHARSEGPGHHRSAGPARAHAGWKWSGEDERSAGTFGTAGSEHAVVMAEGLVMAGDCGAREEDDRRDENKARDDNYPRRSLVEPRRPR